MRFKIDPEFHARLRQQTPDERQRLTVKIESEGCAPGALVVADIQGEKFLIDGHSTYEICIAKRIKLTEPRVIKLPTRELALEWIDDHQEARRNLSPDAIKERRQKRIERVAELRKEGLSTRAIAEQEGISQPQVRRDLKDAGESPVSPDTKVSTSATQSTVESSGETGDSPEPEAAKVVGRDGKSYPANRQSTTDDSPSTTSHRQNNKPPKPTKNGSPSFNDKSVTELLGKLAREFNARAKLFGETVEYKEVRQRWEDLNTAWKDWTKKGGKK
jgi:hypothetical protein